jgi:hypothetical protein
MKLLVCLRNWKNSRKHEDFSNNPWNCHFRPTWCFHQAETAKRNATSKYGARVRLVKTPSAAKKIFNTMVITIETSGIQEIEQLLLVLKTLNIKSIKISESKTKARPIITKGDKKIDPKELFGIWQDKPRTIETIRTPSQIKQFPS